MGAAASPLPHPCQGVQLSWGGWQILGGCDPRPGKAGLSQGLAELVFGVSVPAAGAVWGELMPGAGDRGRAGGSSPGAGEALPGWPRFGAERRRRRRKEGRKVTGCGSGDAAASSCRSKDGVGSLHTPGGDLGMEQDPK